MGDDMHIGDDKGPAPLHPLPGERPESTGIVACDHDVIAAFAKLYADILHEIVFGPCAPYSATRRIPHALRRMRDILSSLPNFAAPKPPFSCSLKSARLQ